MNHTNDMCRCGHNGGSHYGMGDSARACLDCGCTAFFHAAVDATPVADPALPFPVAGVDVDKTESLIHRLEATHRAIEAAREKRLAEYDEQRKANEALAKEVNEKLEWVNGALKKLNERREELCMPPPGCIQSVTHVGNDGLRIAVHRPMSEMRDLFAGQALAGLTVGTDIVREEMEGEPDQSGAIARRAYALADAMLKAREERRNAVGT